MEKRPDKIAALRRALVAHELPQATELRPLGHRCADAVLAGGLRHGALHEVYAGDASQSAAATGFASGFASRLGGDKKLFWVTTDYATLEYGALNAMGLLDFGVDPDRLIVLRMARGEDSLRAASDILAIDAVGALVLEFPSEFRAFDFTASRRLSLASAQRDIPAIVVRLGIKPQASAAETRWLVYGAGSQPPDEKDDWGAPHFDVRLLRNRHGELGNWRMGWDCDNGFFGDRKNKKDAADIVRLAAAPADGPAYAESKNRHAGRAAFRYRRENRQCVANPCA